MSTAVEPVWEIRHISKVFPGVRAVDGASLVLRAGAYQPDEGEILHRGRVLQLRDPNAAKSLGVATFYQELSLVPSLSVAENVHLGRLPRRGGLVSWRRARQRAREALDRLEVSIGDISLLILDEPTAALGPGEVERLHRVVRVLARGAAVLYISHRLEEVLSVADVVTVIRDGRIVGECRTAEASVRDVARMMIGTELEDYFGRERAGYEDTPILEARDLRTENGVNGASFVVGRGEVLGLGGLLGSGRKEIARALFGADRLTPGEILLEGRRLRLRSPTDAIAAGIALLPENRKADGLFFNLLAPPNISIARLGAVSHGPFLQLGKESRRARTLLRQLRLSRRAERRNVSFLSGGNQQKLVLARLLFSEARVLIRDEPTQGIDVGAKREIYGLIDELTSRGAGIVLISSDYPELLSLSDRTAVVRDGLIVHTAPHGELSQQELLELASSRTAEAATA